MAAMTWNDDERAPYIVPRIFSSNEIVDCANAGLTACEAIKQYFIEERERLYIKVKSYRDGGLGSLKNANEAADYDYWSYTTDMNECEPDSEQEQDEEPQSQEEVAEVAEVVEVEVVEAGTGVAAEPLDDPLYRDHNKFAYT